MGVYGGCPRFFRDGLVISSLRSNYHRNFYYDTLTAAFSVVIPTV